MGIEDRLEEWHDMGYENIPSGKIIDYFVREMAKAEKRGAIKSLKDLLDKSKHQTFNLSVGRSDVVEVVDRGWIDDAIEQIEKEIEEGN